MLNLPTIVIDRLNPFAPCFYGVSTWVKAQILLIGTILTPGKRVVTAALRVMGLSESCPFAQYHQVLNRAIWSPLDLAQVLLKLLVQAFTQPGEALVFGIDPTIERRWGHKIAAARAISSRPADCAIWVWKPSANGRTKPLPAPRRCCWACSLG